MAKASMVLPNGTTVTIQGDSNEVAQILARFSPTPTQESEKHQTRAPAKSKTRGASRGQSSRGPTGHILELRDEAYFKSRRSLPDIQARLEEKGHIYAQSSLSPILVRLVRKKEIRRIKDKKGWVYVS